QYAVILEAGVTGTRLHIHNFTDLTYLSTTFHQTRHSLYSYSERPKEAAESIRPLIEQAMQIVPVAQHTCTPIFLRASRSMRLLRQPQREDVMHAVEAFLRDSENSPFRLPDGGVGIMEMAEDTAYTWVTVNHLLGRLNETNPQPDVAVLVLGGSDTQIVFAPSSDMDDDQYKYDLRLGQQSYALYRRSFANNGLVLLRQRVHEQIVDSLRIHASESEMPLVSNPCIARGLTEYATLRLGSRVAPHGESYLMDGGSVGGFDACTTVVDTVLAETFHNAHIPAIDASAPVLLLGYFIDRLEPLLRVRHTDEDLTATTTTVDKIAQLARMVCAGPEAWAERFESPVVHVLADQPSWCLDITVVHRLLTTGYRLEGTREVMVGKTIGSGRVDPGWTIGAAVKLIMDDGASGAGRYV
ncbi:nucleoside phosphatase GDA1/CD39, partial [Mycena amicta]